MSKKNKKIEIEYKFKIDDPIALFQKIEGAPPEVLYIKDEIYGPGIGIPPKVRKRRIYRADGTTEVQYEQTTEMDGDIKTVLEEEVASIPDEFGLENSYEKIRYYFDRGRYEIMVDFYPIGIFCEIEGPERVIEPIAKELGFDTSRTINDNIAVYYRDKRKAEGLGDWYHWGFGKMKQ